MKCRRYQKRVILKTLFISFMFLCPIFFLSSASGSDSDQIKQMDYLLEFTFKNNDGKSTFKTRLQLEINHTGFEFPGNGTIKYTLQDPFVDPRLLYLVSSVFPVEYVNYFTDPSSADYFQVYYFNRTESSNPNFNTTNMYTIFWMQEEQEFIDVFLKFTRLEFFNTSSPKTLPIDEIKTISHGAKRWSETFGGKLFDTQVTTCFIVSRDILIGDDETYIHVYFDRATGVLVYGKYYIKQVSSSSKNELVLEIHQISSNFELADRFNWWLLLTITVFSAVGALAGWIIYNLVRNGGRKKPSRLDEI